MDKKEAQKKVDDLLENMSEADLEGLKEAFKSGINRLISTEQEVLDSYIEEHQKLVDRRQELWDLKRELEWGDKKRAVEEELWEVKSQVDYAESKIKPQKNILQSLRNGGTLMEFTDAKGKLHKNVPDFRGISTDEFSFSEEDILDIERPAYIPLIDEDKFKSKGYVVDAIRIENNSYLLASNGFREEGGSRGVSMIGAGSLAVPTFYVIVSLDQLVLIIDWYFKVAKAKAIKVAEEQTKRNEAYYDKLSEQKRLSHFNQTGYYERGLPAKIRKQITKEEWEALDLEGKEDIYKPFQVKRAKRLTSKLNEDQMWRSFHEMYERFVNPEAKPPRAGYGNPEVFEYWYKFRDMMNFKIKDIRIQREDLSESYQKGIETSYGESGTNAILLDKYGILIKRQNGDEISPTEIEELEDAWKQVRNTFGELKPNALKYNLIVSHSGKKMMFISKNAIGVFIPQMHAIGVSRKYGQGQFESTLAHEVGHFIDYFVGQIRGLRYATDDYEGTAGQVAFTFRNNMNLHKDEQNDYVNATKECFARALQQYFSFKKFGYEGMVDYSEGKLENAERLFSSANFVPQKAWDEKVLPLIEKFFEENQDVLSTTLDLDGSEDKVEIGSEALTIDDVIAQTTNTELFKGLHLIKNSDMDTKFNEEEIKQLQAVADSDAIPTHIREKASMLISENQQDVEIEEVQEEEKELSPLQEKINAFKVILGVTTKDEDKKALEDKIKAFELISNI